MELSKIKTYLLDLPVSERNFVISEIVKLSSTEIVCDFQKIRRDVLNNKQGECPHCNHTKYVKFGFKSGSQRYKCKSCNRSFTEFTGTWIAGLHHKDKIDAYLELMVQEQSLDKIKVKLRINKKTAFDWRHKILSSVSEVDNDDFTGITESDETFFLHSSKGIRVENRKPRNRGGVSKQRGINKDHIAVIVTQDRKKHLDLTVVTKGRLKKINIEQAIGSKVTKQTILCTDGHVSYKGFAKDKMLEHHPLRADLKQFIKNGVYHIQHVNSTHNRLKKWIDNTFWGVSTKYLQQYLNWYKVKETLKNNKFITKSFAEKTVEDINALLKYRNIEIEYQKLISTQF
ncbi:MAG: IS1595 family transposase [Lutibacter sp.]|nr:IS1595 family transposase [Lutibacter sp.]